MSIKGSRMPLVYSHGEKVRGYRCTERCGELDDIHGIIQTSVLHKVGVMWTFIMYAIIQSCNHSIEIRQTATLFLGHTPIEISSPMGECMHIM